MKERPSTLGEAKKEVISSSIASLSLAYPLFLNIEVLTGG
jgi:hypothetical protein